MQRFGMERSDTRSSLDTISSGCGGSAVRGRGTSHGMMSPSGSASHCTTRPTSPLPLPGVSGSASHGMASAQSGEPRRASRGTTSHDHPGAASSGPPVTFNLVVHPTPEAARMGLTSGGLLNFPGGPMPVVPVYGIVTDLHLVLAAAQNQSVSKEVLEAADRVRVFASRLQAAGSQADVSQWTSIVP